MSLWKWINTLNHTFLSIKIRKILSKEYHISEEDYKVRIHSKKIKIFLQSIRIQKYFEKALSTLKDRFSSYEWIIIHDNIKPETPTPSTQTLSMGRHAQKKTLNRDHIKTILAIASGKGGVGKSTIALNLARAFKRQGMRTALLDADIHGPSIPIMTGGFHQAALKEGKIQPIEKEGINLMSIGYMVNPDKPIIWRGPMLSGTLQQMIENVAWGDTDIMIIDMPPGTGDIQLTLCQSLKADGTILISTPQATAIADAEKCLNMFISLQTPLWGLIENMSGFQAPDTGNMYYIFGQGGVENFAQKNNYPYLGSLPIQIDIPYLSDQGEDLYLYDQTKKITNIFDEWADTLTKQYALLPNKASF